MPKVSERHARARRRQILDAARDCFAREGIQRTTMQDIFGASGLSPGAVYTYFFGKEEIVRAVAEEAFSGAVALDPRIVVALWAEALRDARIMALARTMDQATRAEILELALRPG